MAFYTPPQAAIASTHQTLPRLSDLLRLNDAGLRALLVDWLDGCFTAASLEEALAALDADREFLTRGGVFSNDFIDAYIELKMDEVNKTRMTAHPVEFQMYYSL